MRSPSEPGGWAGGPSTLPPVLPILHGPLTVPPLRCIAILRRQLSALDALLSPAFYPSLPLPGPPFRYLGLGSYAEWDEERRLGWLEEELSGRRPLIPPSMPFTPDSQEVVATLK